MKQFLLILGLLCLLAAPATASAHPANPTCSNDGCTGYRVHDTATCANSLTVIETQGMYNHSGRQVGVMSLYKSNTCDAYYDTALSWYGPGEMNNVAVDFSGGDDNADTEWFYAGQGAGVYADGKMIGNDPEPINECYSPIIFWKDYSGANRSNFWAQYCTSS